MAKRPITRRAERETDSEDKEEEENPTKPEEKGGSVAVTEPREQTQCLINLNYWEKLEN